MASGRMSMGRRNELAAAKLQALGIRPAPGKSAYGQYQKLSSQQKAAGAQRLAARDPGYRGGGKTARAASAGRAAARRTADQLAGRSRTNAGGTITKSGQPGVVRAAVQAAAQQGTRVAFLAAFRNAAGQVRQRYIDRSFGVLQGSRTASDGTDLTRANLRDKRPAGQVQVIFGAGVEAGGGGGLDPDDVLALMDQLGIWGALYALWDEQEVSP